MELSWPECWASMEGGSSRCEMLATTTGMLPSIGDVPSVGCFRMTDLTVSVKVDRTLVAISSGGGGHRVLGLKILRPYLQHSVKKTSYYSPFRDSRRKDILINIGHHQLGGQTREGHSSANRSIVLRSAWETMSKVTPWTHKDCARRHW